MKNIVTIAVLSGFISIGAHADVTVTIDQSAMNFGWMNVSELPVNGGGFVFGSSWGVSDLSASFDTSGSVVTMIPNSVDDPDPFWYIGGGGPGAAGNKIMGANLFANVTGTFAGQTVTFEGNVLSNTLTSDHEVVAFIRDFVPDYSWYIESTVPLSSLGEFSVSMATINDPARHVQFGIEMTGVNVWVTDLDPFGSIVIAAIPEPATLSMIGLVTGGIYFSRRFFIA